MYSTVEDADAYFDTRLYSDSWVQATEADKEKALEQAARIIDSLMYIGEKLDSTQENEFPRLGQDAVPDSILYAAYEIAHSLIDGVDPELEMSNLSIISQGFVGVRATSSRDFVHAHLRAGVPSAVAWTYLKQYLADPNNVRIRRIS